VHNAEHTPLSSINGGPRYRRTGQYHPCYKVTTVFREKYQEFWMTSQEISGTFSRPITMRYYRIMLNVSDIIQKILISWSRWSWKNKIQGLSRPSSIKFRNLLNLLWFSKTFQVLEKWEKNCKDLWPYCQHWPKVQSSRRYHIHAVDSFII